MWSVAASFAKALSAVKRPGAFFVAGTEEMLAPGIAVEGIGPIALPLLPVQAEQIIAAAERAPYGRGEDTLTDTEVRRTWQIGAERVRIAGRHWPRTLQSIEADLHVRARLHTGGAQLHVAEGRRCGGRAGGRRGCRRFRL